ncbi:hypothetical protein ASC90_20460 [Rhizobium sp. Root1220]|nr:hypothetical protein ASC90_20460 [Rhizobium sp. Root1220]
MPAGAPGVPPDVDHHDLLTLIIALASDATLAKAAEAVESYSALTPGGADVTGAPATVPRTAREALTAFAELAAEGDALSSMAIEVVATWPEIAIRWSDGTVQRFRETGALASHWADSRQRKSVTIPGTAFAAVFKELFA